MSYVKKSLFSDLDFFLVLIQNISVAPRYSGIFFGCKLCRKITFKVDQKFKKAPISAKIVEKLVISNFCNFDCKIFKQKRL